MLLDQLKKEERLGLGVLGWHTLLQQKGIAFEGLLAQFKTREIFSQLKLETERASRDLADVYGEPLWCVGTGMRNTHLRAIAPTVSKSVNFPVMYHLVLNLGLLMYLQNNLLKVHL